MSKAQNGFVEVEFKKNYMASRGAPISGSKGQVKSMRMSDQLQACIDDGICAVVKAGKAEKRETAAGKKANAEKS